MIKFESIKADMKTLLREPILVFFVLLPLLIFILFKLLLRYAVPLLTPILDFDLTLYYGYIVTVAIIITPSMLGTVTAFLMIDERDSRINELILITPVSKIGYLINRLSLPFLGSLLYTLIGYYILNIYEVSLYTLLYIGVLTGIQGVLIGIFLYTFAADKVQGLTYSKGLGILSILALADLLQMNWVTAIAFITPFYWITQLIHYPDFKAFTISLFLHAMYLFYCIRKI